MRVATQKKGNRVTGRHRRDHPPDRGEDPRDERQLVDGGPTRERSICSEVAHYKPFEGSANTTQCRVTQRGYGVTIVIHVVRQVVAMWLVTELRQHFDRAAFNPTEFV